jgi:hypothetical protein
MAKYFLVPTKARATILAPDVEVLTAMTKVAQFFSTWVSQISHVESS